MANNLVRQIFSKKDIFYFTYTLVNTLLIQFLWIITPILMGIIIDTDLPNRNFRQATFHIAIICTIPIIGVLLGAVYQKIFIKKVWDISLGAKEKIFTGIVHQTAHFYKNSKQSDLQNACSTDLTGFVLYYLSDIPTILAQLLITFAVLFYIGTINLVILILCLISIPVIIYPGKALLSRVMSLSQSVFNLNRKSSNLINETFIKNKLVKAYSLEEKKISKLKNINKDLAQEWSKITFLDYLAGNWSEQLIYPLFFAMCFGYSIWEMSNGNLRIGEIITIIGIMPRMYSTIGSIIKSNMKVGQKHKEYENLVKYLELYNQTEYESQSGANNASKHSHNYLEFRRVSFRFPDSESILFDNISFSVRRGSINILNGRNGLGKSTLFDLIIKLYEPIKGDILLNGNSIRSISGIEVRKEVLLVSQFAQLFSTTIRENFKLADASITDREIWGYLSEVGLEEQLRKQEITLDSMISDSNENFSGGQRQRLALAIGFAKKSELLLLDEIDVNIDSNSEKMIYTAIEKRAKQHGVTVVIITHKESLPIEVDEYIEIENRLVEHVN